jgi:mannose-6-phosphate isomerase-like protein (cupin superfamily)
MIETITRDGALLALIIPRQFREQGIHFFTPPELSQQLAFMRHPAGKAIDAHVHNPVARNVVATQEVLFIRSGKMRVDFYTAGREYIGSRVLEGGDAILLASGGHGFEVLEEVEMIEVKQGPYAGDGDKTRFDGVSAREAVLTAVATESAD